MTFNLKSEVVYNDKRDYLHKCCRSIIYLIQGVFAPLFFISSLMAFIAESYRDFVLKYITKNKYFYILLLCPFLPIYIVGYTVAILIEGLNCWVEDFFNIY